MLVPNSPMQRIKLIIKVTNNVGNINGINIFSKYAIVEVPWTFAASLSEYGICDIAFAINFEEINENLPTYAINIMLELE